MVSPHNFRDYTVPHASACHLSPYGAFRPERVGNPNAHMRYSLRTETFEANQPPKEIHLAK